MSKALTKTPEERKDRVRAHTRPALNSRIDRETDLRVRYYASEDDVVLSERIRELDEETDIEQVLQANAATLTMLGVIFGLTASRKWLFVPLMVGAFLFQHAVKGWCPPMPVMRRIGLRTRKEIERERNALKAVRGDFQEIQDRRPR